MNILQVCHKVPYPPKDGGCIAINNLTNGLIDLGHYVKVLAINTPKHYTDIASLPKEYRDRTHIEAVDVDTGIKPMDAFINLFGSESYNMSRFYSKAFEEKLIEILCSQQFDIVQLESLYTTPYLDAIRKHSKAKVVLRSHNVEFMLWERNMQQSSGLKKAYLSILAKRLKKYELDMLNKYDGIAAITPEDAGALKKLGCTVPLITVPFGLNADEYPVPANDNTSLFHIGAMDWAPNLLAMEWLLNNVWDKLVERYPDAELHLAGRSMPGSFRQLNKKNVFVEGEVDDAKAFMAKHSIMIAPLFTGGGMRIKIIEAMAMGKVVITTKLGMEGISAENGKQVLLAEDPGQFIEAIGRCMNDEAFRKQVGSNARRLVEERYDNRSICKSLAGFYSQLWNIRVTA